MKKFLSVVVLAFSFIIFAHSAQAFEVKVDNSVNLTKEEIADGNVYASCDDMKIDGTVNGDVIALCKSVTINGTINGDLIVFSQDITVNGEVKGSARMAGTNITVNGTIDHNINAFGTEINLTPSSTVAWDVLISGVNGKFNGIIGGNLHGSVATANIAGKIGKNINLTIEDYKNSQGGLLITKDAIVGGGLSYTAKKEAQLESLSSVVGPVSHQTPKETSETPIEIISTIFYKLSALFLIGLILISLKKKTVYDVAQNLELKNLAATLIGLGALILTPIVILFFAITIIGIPFALILLAAYLILLTLSLIFASFFVGNMLLKSFIKKPLNAFVILLFGLTIFVLLSSMPYIGWAFTLVFMTYGLGGALITIKNYLYA
jgi:Protein of unknown function, DUF583.